MTRSILLAELLLLCTSNLVFAGHHHHHSEPKRGFLLVATDQPVQDLSLSGNTSRLGVMLDRLCGDFEANVVVVVGSETEAHMVNSYLIASSCASGKVMRSRYNVPHGRVIPAPGVDNGVRKSYAIKVAEEEKCRLARKHDEQIIKFVRALRLFKVSAIKNHWTTAGEEVIYLDNDALPKKGTYDALFATFGTMRENKFSVGFHVAPTCEPEHHRIKDIPLSFCEYNSGVGFFHGTGASAIFDDWLTEFNKGESVDGHDQLSLRRVLYRHRSALYELPDAYNCRCRKQAAVNACLNLECLIMHCKGEWCPSFEYYSRDVKVQFQTANPRMKKRLNSSGVSDAVWKKTWRRYESYQNAETVGEFSDKGGTASDLEWAFGHGYVLIDGLAGCLRTESNTCEAGV